MESKVLNIIKERFSVRHYKAAPIEEEKLDLIIEAARLAPSATNTQPWHFYVVKDPDKIKALAEKMPLGSSLVSNSFIAQAPVVIVATAGPIELLHKVMSFIVNRKWYYLDVAIAVENMSLTAWELGIGSCWIGWFDEKRVRSLLAIPRDQEVIIMLTLGYWAGEGQPHAIPKNRKRREEIIKFVE